MLGAAGARRRRCLPRPALARDAVGDQGTGKVLIGIQGDNPPWGFVNTSGKQDGFDADIAALFGKELGVAVEFVPLDVVNRIPALTIGPCRYAVRHHGDAAGPRQGGAVQQALCAPTSSRWSRPRTTEIKTNADMGKFVIGVPRAQRRRTRR